MSKETTEPAATTPQSFMATVTAWITGKDTRLTQAEAQVANLAAIQTQLTQAQADLATAKTTISTLTDQVASLTTATVALKERDATVTKLSTYTETEINRRANLLAGERLSKAGIATTPVTEEKSAAAGNAGATLLEQINAITDPVARGQFIRKNAAEIAKHRGK